MTEAATENQLHSAVSVLLSHALRAGAYFFHVPNDAKRSRDVTDQRRLTWDDLPSATAARLKKMGIRAGYPDLTILFAGRAYLIELKSARGRVTDAQTRAHALIADAGCPVAVCRSVEQVHEQLRDWGLVRGDAA